MPSYAMPFFQRRKRYFKNYIMSNETSCSSNINYWYIILCYNIVAFLMFPRFVLLSDSRACTPCQQVVIATRYACADSSNPQRSYRPVGSGRGGPVACQIPHPPQPKFKKQFHTYDDVKSFTLFTLLPK
jgi:hypothetical protein